MDIEYYESTIQKMEEARLLIEALEDAERRSRARWERGASKIEGEVWNMSLN